MTWGFLVENKALPNIMSTNLYPFDHLANLNSSRSRFLYDVIKGVSIDICYHIYHCFCQQGSLTSSRNGLLFPSLVLKICGYFSVNCPDLYTTLPRVGLISSSILAVNVYYVMGFRPFRPNYFTCTAHLYLYCTLLVPHTYASYIRHWCIFSH